MSVSLVIAAHAKVERLRLTLAAVEGLQDRASIEVIVVADGANDAVLALLEAQGNALRLLHSAGVGRAGARNVGAREAAGDLLVFVDDDILFDGSFVRAHQTAQRRQRGLVHGQLRELVGLYRVSDPASGGPHCPPVDEAALRRGQWQPGNARLVANALEQAAEHPLAPDQWPWLAAAGANISVPKAVWASVGGFDESYGVRWGLEDIDFAFRLWRRGVSVTLDREARGYHMSHERGERWQEQGDNLRQFQRLANCPQAHALGELLSPAGSVTRYIARVDQIRQRAREPSVQP